MMAWSWIVGRGFIRGIACPNRPPRADTSVASIETAYWSVSCEVELSAGVSGARGQGRIALHGPRAFAGATRNFVIPQLPRTGFSQRSRMATAARSVWKGYIQF